MQRYFGGKQPENVGVYIKAYTESLIRTWFRRFHISTDYVDLVIIAMMDFIDQQFDEGYLEEEVTICHECPVQDGKEDAYDDAFCRDYGLLCGKKPTPGDIQAAVQAALEKEFLVCNFMEAVGEFGDMSEINKLDRPDDEVYGFGLS